MTDPAFTGDSRFKELTEWVDGKGYDTDSLIPASFDASHRRYFRIENEDHSLIVMDSTPAQNDNKLFIEISLKLKDAGLTVPKIIDFDLNKGFIILSDLGSRHYLDELDQNNVRSLYADAMNAIVTMQNKLNTEGLPDYSEQVLRMEMNLFPIWYLGEHQSIVLSQEQQSVLSAVFDACVANALEQPQVFVHRDFHSRNLMIHDQQNPGILDYQGALTGPVTYDLVSLLKDCYVHWPEPLVDELMSEFYQRLIRRNVLDIGLPSFRRWFDFMGLQRHIKVLGIFCRLKYRDGKNGYMNDLPLVYHYIQSVCDKYPELSAFKQMLIDVGIEDEFI